MRENRAEKPEVMRVLGMMSGTSLDGVDAAVIETDGERICARGARLFRPFAPEEQLVLRAALGLWAADDPRVAQARALITKAHAEAAAQFTDYDLIGFHGQTLAHEPAKKRTHQCADGDALGALTGRSVVWDFRSHDVAMGGEGAPLAPVYHAALMEGAPKGWAILNLGGVGNITYLGTKGLTALDTGPANAPMNDLIARAHHGAQLYDADGALAAKGRADEALIAKWMQHPFFAAPPPKSLDRDSFAPLFANLERYALPDALRTLAGFTGASVAHALKGTDANRIYATGGGRHNPTLCAEIAARSGCALHPIEALGVDGDYVEAEAFAYLAMRHMRGLPLSFPGTTGVPEPLAGGRLSRPAQP